MRHFRVIVLLLVSGFLVAACAKPPQGHSLQAGVTSFAPLENHLIVDKGIAAQRGTAELAISNIAKIKKTTRVARIETAITNFKTPTNNGRLQGRTIWINTVADIQLRPGEVVLTFDDGPHPTRTPKILQILENYRVRATFLMVGQMAKAYPSTARMVAKAGHSIGTHTYDHANLANLSSANAYGKILKGARAVSSALDPIGFELAPFFRFPYLAQTNSQRNTLASHDLVVLDVDIDSRDYRPHAPGELNRRTMARLKAKGKGVILFHDIQPRTVANLAAFLDQLKDEGFKVVHLAHRGTNNFNIETANSY